MLDVFKDKQSLFYEEISNSIKNNKISHAYLIETNEYKESDNLIINFIKELFLASTDDDSLFQNMCNLIDNNAFSDFIIIEPDGQWIKKEQILEVKEKFKMTSFRKNPRIYWIKECDKLNKYAANSLLKFLEEPEGNIIAILETTNRYRVLETIRSRCQILSLINSDKNKDIENIDLLTNIITLLENKGSCAIAYLPNILENDLRNRDFWNNIFNEMINIYENCLRKMENVNYNDYGEILDKIISNNSVDKIINKIDVLFTMKRNFEYNLNINMMLDKFIIDFSGGD